MEQRTKELDFLKTIAILLVIVIHLVYISEKYPYAKLIELMFPMPMFLLISGYLANEGKSVKEFARKMLWIFIPYLVMETGYVFMSHVLPVRVRVPEITLAVVLYHDFIRPLGPYWYLHTLIICSVIHYLVFHYGHMRKISYLVTLGFAFFTVSQIGGILN